MLPYHKKLLLSSAGNAQKIKAAHFDGGDNIYRGSSLVGSADSFKGTLSFWIRPNVTAGSPYSSMAVIIGKDTGGSGSLRYDCFINSSNNLILRLRTDNGSSLLIVNLVLTITDLEWNHILVSYDASSNVVKGCVNDVIQVHGIMWESNTSDTIDHTLTEWGVGKGFNTYNEYVGDMADFWINFGTYIDLTVVSNRRKFITDEGLPADMGADGSTPLGSQPPIFFSIQDGEDATDFSTNKGNGGAWVENGTLTNSI